MTTPAPPPPYGAYPPPYDPYGYPGPRPTNGLAIASLICAFLFAPLGIIFGHISLSQIKRTGEEGHGLAVAGLVISYLITVGTILALVAVTVLAVLLARNVQTSLDDMNRHPGITAAPTPDNGLPEFDPPPNLGANCAYPTTTEPASKPNKPPRSGRVPTDPAQVSASLSTNRGNIGLQLDNGKAPCTVNSFASLAQQGYFDGTTCHRLTTTPLLGVLQCGDPIGHGDRRTRLPVRQRVPHQPVPARRSGAEDAGDVSARHAGDGQRGLGNQRQPVLPRLRRLDAAADLHRVRHASTPPASPRWTRSPLRGSSAAATTASPPST